MKLIVAALHVHNMFVINFRDHNGTTTTYIFHGIFHSNKNEIFGFNLFYSSNKKKMIIKSAHGGRT